MKLAITTILFDILSLCLILYFSNFAIQKSNRYKLKTKYMCNLVLGLTYGFIILIGTIFMVYATVVKFLEW